MNPHLFVYGSLLSTRTEPFGRALRQRLARDSRLLGPATILGRLYDLGRYPGLVDAADAREITHGELVSLTMPLAALRWLDAYEGIAAGSGRDDEEYKRVERTVSLLQPAASPQAPAKPRSLKAWVYIYRRDTTDLRQVPGGRWGGPV